MINEGLPTFFAQVEYPEYWLLPEVLYWIAFNRVPRAEFDQDGCELRESALVYHGQVFDITSWLIPPLSVFECKANNLPIDPRTEQIRRYRDFDDYDEEDRERADHEFRWKLNEYLDEPMSQLHRALKTGELNAVGVKAPSGAPAMIQQFIEEKIGDGSISGDAFERIPESGWLRESIRVDDAGLDVSDGYFGLIQIAAEDVLQVFPPEEGETLEIQASGAILMRLPRVEQSPPGQPKRGRPTKNWEAVHAQIAALILKEGGLPQKRESVAAEIIEWYSGQFPDEISRSSIMDRLKSYYANDLIKKK